MAYGWHVDVCVLAGLEAPGSGHLDGEAAGIAGEGLDEGFAASVAEVAVRDY